MLAELEYWRFFLEGLCLRLREGAVYWVELWRSPFHKFRRLVCCWLLNVRRSSDLGEKPQSVNPLICWDRSWEKLYCQDWLQLQNLELHCRTLHSRSIRFLQHIQAVVWLSSRIKMELLLRALFFRCFLLCPYRLSSHPVLCLTSEGNVSTLNFILSTQCWCPFQPDCMLAERGALGWARGSVKLCTVSDFMYSHVPVGNNSVMLTELQTFGSI